LGELALLDQAAELDDDGGFEQHVLGVGEPQVSKNVAAADFDFPPARARGLRSPSLDRLAKFDTPGIEWSTRQVPIRVAILAGITLTSELVRAARALLRWEQRHLSETSGVSLPTVKRLEAQPGVLGAHPTIVAALQRALEAGGVEFTDGAQPGIRMRPFKVGDSVRFRDGSRLRLSFKIDVDDIGTITALVGDGTSPARVDVEFQNDQIRGAEACQFVFATIASRVDGMASAHVPDRLPKATEIAHDTRFHKPRDNPKLQKHCCLPSGFGKLDVPRGTERLTTIRGILLQLDPAGVERVFREHARTLCAHEKTPRGEHRHVAFDGKALCNSFGQFEDRKAAHVLSASRPVWRSSSLTSSVTKNPTKSPGPRSSSPN
jgi:hypothetical protein